MIRNFAITLSVLFGVLVPCFVAADTFPPDAITFGGSTYGRDDLFYLSGPSSVISDNTGYTGPITLLYYHMHMSAGPSSGFSAIVCSDNPVDKTLPYIDGRDSFNFTISDKPIEDYGNAYPWRGIETEDMPVSMPCSRLYLDNSANSGGEIEWSITYVPRLIASTTYESVGYRDWLIVNMWIVFFLAIPCNGHACHKIFSHKREIVIHMFI